jgi:DNA-binding transcriptional MerR regulator
MGNRKPPFGEMKERFSIGEAAEFFGISRDLLRYYEKEGLISPSGQSASRYRQYSFADLLKLNYVRVLRAIDLSLEDIAAFIDELDLPGQDGILAGKWLELDRRIRELERVRDEVFCYRKGIEEARRLFGICEIATSPRFVLSSVEEAESDLFLMESRDALSENRLTMGSTYSLLIRAEYFSGSLLEDCAQPLSSALWVGGDEAPPAGGGFFEAQACLHTVFASRVRVSDGDLGPIRERMARDSLEVAGDALCQYLAFEKEGEGFVDYVEAWIPIK